MEPVPLQRATPVLHVRDYPRARAFYVNRLGFVVHEEGGSPPRFGILDRGAAVIYLDAWHGAVEQPPGWTAYFHVAEVDALYAEYADLEVPFHRERHETPHGTLEFEVIDPDGNILCFGQPLP